MFIKIPTKQQLAWLSQYSPCYKRYTLSEPEEAGILKV
jgi:hypothetical protein